MRLCFCSNYVCNSGEILAELSNPYRLKCKPYLQSIVTYAYHITQQLNFKSPKLFLPCTPSSNSSLLHLAFILEVISVGILYGSILLLARDFLCKEDNSCLLFCTCRNNKMITKTYFKHTQRPILSSVITKELYLLHVCRIRSLYPLTLTSALLVYQAQSPW